MPKASKQTTSEHGCSLLRVRAWTSAEIGVESQHSASPGQRVLVCAICGSDAGASSACEMHPPGHCGFGLAQEVRPRTSPTASPLV